MKNFALKISLVASMVYSFALADGLFTGIESDYSFQSNLKVKYNNAGDTGIIKYKKAQAGIGLKAGYDFDRYRVYSSYIYDFQASKDMSYDPDYTVKWLTHKFILGADYTPSITDNFKLAVGPYGGYSRLKVKINDITGYSDKDSKNGWLIGTKIGGIYSFDKNNELEIGFKADRTNYGKMAEFDSEEFNADNVKEINYGLYLGYNYKF